MVKAIPDRIAQRTGALDGGCVSEGLLRKGCRSAVGQFNLAYNVPTGLPLAVRWLGASRHTGFDQFQGDGTSTSQSGFNVAPCARRHV